MFPHSSKFLLNEIRDPCSYFLGGGLYDGCNSISASALETQLHIKLNMPWECTHLRFNSQTAP